MIPPPTPYSFHDAFWTSTSQLDSIPQFRHGLSVLHTKLAQSTEENTTILAYLSRRIHAEQQYAHYLNTAMDGRADDVFDRDMGASLKQCFQVVQNESKSSAEAHLSRATNLMTTALDPVERMAAKFSKIITTSKATIDSILAAFDIQSRTTVEARLDYINRCKRLLANDPSYRPSYDAPVVLANKAWPRSELTLLLNRLQQTHHPLFGQNILDEMMAHYDTENNSSCQDAVLACQHLLSQGWISTSAATDLTTNDDYRQSTGFTTSLDVVYTVHPLNRDSLCDTNSSREELSPVEADASTSVVSYSLSFWSRQRWMGTNTKQNECQQELSQEMHAADEAYKQAVQKLERIRMELEENLFMHFEEMESLELERIQTLKQAFISMAAAFSNTIPIYKDVYDRMMLYQETLRPDKDVQAVVEQYRTSRFCPRPVLYENYFTGTADGQLFGVALEDVVKREKTQVPVLISSGLAVIESELCQLCDKECQKIWTTPLPLDLVHKARNELNSTASPIDQATLKGYDLLLLSSVLRLYLLELPGCLVTFELYDTLKLLYANQNQQDKVSHLISIGKLMTTLPSANYETLKVLSYHLNKLIQKANNSNMLQTLVSRFTQIIIRPDVVLAANRHDRHPHKFVRDLLEHTDTIFSREIDQGQATHHIRQQQRVTVAPTLHSTASSRHSSLELDNKLPSLDESSMASTLSVSYPPSEDFNTGYVQTSAKEKGNKVNFSVAPAAVMPIVTTSMTEYSPPTRRRSFMSYVRRSNSKQESNVFGGSLGQTETSGRTINNPSRRPMPMPSTSTLFEDPEEVGLATKLLTSKSTPTTTLPRNIPSVGIPHTHSRMSSSSSFSLEEDDHITLDSFFL